MQGKLEKDRDVWGIPKKERRPVAKSLSEIEQQSVYSNTAIKTAYATGSYSQREIGEHFHLHPGKVGVIAGRGKDSRFGA